MGVGLKGQVTVGICSPALSDMTSVAVDFFAVALSAILLGKMSRKEAHS
jgi:hypothetical protein